MQSNKVYNNICVVESDYVTVVGCDCEFDQQFIDKTVSEIKSFEGVKVEDFQVDKRGDDWLALANSDIVVLCSDVNVERAVEEYKK
jgi:hypothetical protein